MWAITTCKGCFSRSTTAPASIKSPSTMERTATGWCRGNSLPVGPDELDEYLRAQKVRYFVARALGCGAPGAGQQQSARCGNAYDLLNYLLPGSRLLLTDPLGWELRE